MFTFCQRSLVHIDLTPLPPSRLDLRDLHLWRRLISIPTLPLHPPLSFTTMIMPAAFAPLTMLVPPTLPLPFPLPTHPCPTIIIIAASTVIAAGVAV